MPRTRSAVRRPSASQPAQYSRRIGCRLAWISRLSSRDSVHFTGRSSSHAASDACAWLLMSSLPPNAPPFDTSVDGDLVVVEREHAGDVVAVVPHTLTAGVHLQMPVVSTTDRHGERALRLEERVLDALRVERPRAPCGRLAAKAGVDVAARVLADASARCVSVPHTAIGASSASAGDGIGDRRQHVVADLDQLRGVAGPAGVSRRRRSPAHRRRRTGATADRDHHRPVLVDDARRAARRGCRRR